MLCGLSGYGGPLPCPACNAEEDAAVRKQVKAERRRRLQRETLADAKRLYRAFRAHARKLRPLLLEILGLPDMMLPAGDLELRRLLLSLEKQPEAGKALGRIVATATRKGGRRG
jgi:hypothetical protein